MEEWGLISVIVPVYGVEAYLKRCVDSIVDQTYRDLEIILVDDGSPDNSGRICDEYAQKDQRIKVIHKENGGISSARNAGLDIATGAYIGFVDGDDYIDPDMYRQLLGAMLEHQTDVACVGILREHEQSGVQRVIRCPKKPTVYSAEGALTEILYARDVGISVWSKLYRKSVFDSVRFPVGETSEEAHILMDLMHGRRMVHIAKPLYRYMARDNSLTACYRPAAFRFALRNARKINDFIKVNAPELRRAGRFYLANTLYTLLAAYQSQNQVVDNAEAEYFSLYRKYWKYLLIAPSFPVKQKMKAIVLRINLLKKNNRGVGGNQ